ncbi:MAG: M23 family metallopeptidase [Roseburia sp.]|nr:M23 family metallopeptidase [Anaeroplasma bactoclasticum]MCM1195917.1 M23 family metallopeptidase [Roseburia sp.]MCM1556595.1 M23 family metallopeptidase [Anaeroplasma bactoclasticum]
MKDKIKRFFIDKKELLVFIAVVVVVFATVITIATLALNDTPVSNDDPIQKPGNDDTPTITPGNDDDKKPDTPTLEQPKVKFAVPVQGECEVVRIFFDLALSDEELDAAVITTGGYFIESKGISYAKSDNSVFDVCSIYDGKVTSVEEDELDGVCVTIKHAADVVSIYSSLSNVSVKVNDTVKVGQVIGKASTSLADVEAGVHVHLEVKVNNAYVNPTTVFGKELSEVQTGK